MTVLQTVLSFREAKNRLNDPYSCFNLVTASKHIALLPKYLGDIKAGVLDVLDSEIKIFSEKFDGVVIAYSNVRSKQNVGAIIGDQPEIHFDIQAEFIIFKPTLGNVLKGVVNKISVNHIGCLVHGCFNASIGHVGLDIQSTGVTVGQELLFEVVDIFIHNNVLSMRGKLTTDRSTVGDDVTDGCTPKRKRKWNTESTESTSTENSQVEIEDTDVIDSSKKKKTKHKSIESTTAENSQVESENNLTNSPKKKKTKHKSDTKDSSYIIAHRTHHSSFCRTPTLKVKTTGSSRTPSFKVKKSSSGCLKIT